MGESTKSDFKAIIVGAGISGLTTAHLLSRLGVDYQILEAHEKVVHAAGGSFGIWPNAARILDQIGCWEDIQKICKPLKLAHIRRLDGSSQVSSNIFSSIFSEYGYDFLVLERHKFIRVLYDNLQDKHKILTGKRVTNILENSDGVQVYFGDGACKGDIVVGCDGVHSTVRQMMWAKANTLSTGLVNALEKRSLTSSYRCLVGVAPSIAGLEETESNVIQNKGFSTLVVTQPETTFFFVCIKEQIISHWPNRRTFTAANAEEEAMKIADMPVTNNVLFGEIWARRTRSYLCALEEGVLKHWFFKRTALLGDSVHKFSPVGAHGGNCAVESAAAFANSLDQYWTHKNGTPDNEDIQNIFQWYQNSREARVRMIYRAVHFMTRVGTLDTRAKRILARFVLPWMNDTAAVSALIKDAPKANFIAIPARSKGFADSRNLDGQPKSKGTWLEIWTVLAYAAMGGFACTVIVALRNVLLL